jgi:hypothetical protein
MFLVFYRIINILILLFRRPMYIISLFLFLFQIYSIQLFIHIYRLF